MFIMSEQTEIVKYYVINKYLDSLNKRFDAQERPLTLFKEYCIILLYAFQTIKFFVMLFINFENYEVRLLLFDISLFMGGIEKYNTFIFFCGSIFGAYLHKMLYLTTSKKFLFWTQSIYMATGSVSPFELVSYFKDRSIANKFIYHSKLIFKISNLLVSISCKNFSLSI